METGLKIYSQLSKGSSFRTVVVQKLHLALFYVDGLFSSIALRISRIKHVCTLISISLCFIRSLVFGAKNILSKKDFSYGNCMFFKETLKA